MAPHHPEKAVGVRPWRLAAGVAVILPILSPAIASSEPFEATRARPLFSPTRRPPPAVPSAETPPPQAESQPPPAPPALSLSGIISGEGTAIAILRRASESAAIRVPLGSQIDGWRVSAIQQRAVVLEHEGRSVTIVLPGPSK